MVTVMFDILKQVCSACVSEGYIAPNALSDFNLWTVLEEKLLFMVGCLKLDIILIMTVV